MRQAGILAAAGIFALDNNIERLVLDHENALLLYDGLKEIPYLFGKLSKVQTNMLFIDLDENVNFQANQQMVVAKALINTSFKIYPGMAVQCRVICDEITIFEFLKRGIHLRF